MQHNLRRILISIIDIFLIMLTFVSAYIFQFPPSMGDILLFYAGFILVIGGILRLILYKKQYRYSFICFAPVILGPLLIISLGLPRTAAMILTYLIGLILLAGAVDNWYIENPVRKVIRKVYDYFKMPELK